MAEKTIEIKDLVVEYRTRSGVVQALNGLSLSIEKGKTLGLVGETGAGKTTAGLAVLGLIPSPPGVIVSGEILLNGKDLRALTDKEMDQIRGDAVAMIFQDPMTSCGCFECICGIEPMSMGVIVVNREFKGMTPVGMTFGELASCTGGGVQTPGYMGHGRHFISSKKFISAEGGIERIVWMPKELKDDVAEKLNKTAKELYGIDNFTDMVADETVTTDCEELLNWLTEKGHPVLGLEPLM